MGSVDQAQVQVLDALVVGAGFGGVYQLKKLRDEGYKVKLVEAGTDYGGVWYWNRYPGARVDSATPHYEFDDPALWNGWAWKQRFPDSSELRAYFAHAANIWDLRKDTDFNTFIQSASWDDGESRWTVTSKAGGTYRVKFLLLNVGFAAKRYIPDWEGINKFKGLFLHPSYWPHQEPDLKGKKVAVIGTGSTGIQIAAELAPIVGELTVFQRTINMAMPMGQVNYQNGQQSLPREAYPDLFRGRVDSFSGFSFSFLSRGTFDDDEETRLATYESLWRRGDFGFWLATYRDMLFDEAANLQAYNFWRDKTRARIHDARVRDILAPMIRPYAFGCKRISLETGFFEIFNSTHVHLVDVNATPIENFTETGIRTADGQHHDFDVVICATGYDAITGGLAQIDIRGQGADGESLAQHWKDGAYTYLGMSVSGFPNMFFTYGPQAPTALCNGPTCAQLQGNWIVGAMNYMRDRGLRKIVAQREEETKWREQIWKLANMSLLPGTKSWYMGDNIPGKPREPLIYLGGVPTYYKTLSDVAEQGYCGFQLE